MTNHKLHNKHTEVYDNQDNKDTRTQKALIHGLIIIVVPCFVGIFLWLRGPHNKLDTNAGQKILDEDEISLKQEIMQKKINEQNKIDQQLNDMYANTNKIVKKPTLINTQLRNTGQEYQDLIDADPIKQAHATVKQKVQEWEKQEGDAMYDAYHTTWNELNAIGDKIESEGNSKMAKLRESQKTFESEHAQVMSHLLQYLKKKPNH